MIFFQIFIDLCLTQPSSESLPPRADRNPQPDYAEREIGAHSSKWDGSIKFCPFKVWKRRWKEQKSQRGWETTGEQDPLNKLSKGHMNSQREVQ